MKQDYNRFSEINQRLKHTAKDKTWRMSVVDALCAEGDRQLSNKAKLQENYDLYNSQVSPDLFNEVCGTLGFDQSVGVKFIEKFNILPGLISAFLEEELFRPFSLNVINNNSNVVNEIVAERDYKLRKYLNATKNKTLERISKTEALAVKYEESIKSKTPMSLSKYNANLADINKGLNEKYKVELDKEAYKESITNMLTLNEETISNIVKLLKQRLNIKHHKNNAYEDVLKVAMFFVEITPNRSNDFPKLQELNPLNVYYEQSEDVGFIQDRNWQGYVKRMPIASAATEYDFTKDELDLITRVNSTAAYGTNDIMHRRKGLGPNDWATKTKAGLFTNNTAVPLADGSLATLPNYSGMTTAVNGKGLHAGMEGRYDADSYCTVYTNYWISQRKVGIFRFINEHGELEEELVNEYFNKPKGANRETFIEDRDKHNLFAKKKTRYVWYDDEGSYFSLQWIWLPEVWQGTRINDQFYKRIQPVQHAYQSLKNPYTTKLPIYGSEFNDRNTYAQSLTDRVRPWYKTYLVMIAKWLKAVADDKGIITFLNTDMVSEKIGWKNTIGLLSTTSVVPYNTTSSKQGVAFNNTAKVAERIDASNSAAATYYMEQIDKIEQKIKNVSNMSDERMNQVREDTGSNSNNSRYVYKTSEVLCAKHDLVWEQVLQGLLEMTISMYDDSDKVLRGYLSNEEIGLMNVTNISLEDEYIISLQLSTKVTNMLKDNYQMLHAMFQNDKIDLETMMDLLEKDDTASLKKALRVLKKREEAIMAKQQESEQAHAKELLQIEVDAREDEQMAKTNDILLKGKLDYEKAYMQSQMLNTSFAEDKDHNSDGIPDFMQMEQLNQRIRNETDKNNISREKLELDKAIASENNSLNKEKLSKDRLKDQQDVNIKNKELAQKKKDSALKARAQ